jgi:AraC-like DNA-binding protein
MGRILLLIRSELLTRKMGVFYSEISTRDVYKPYIKKFWILNNLQNFLSTPAKYALPNGCCTIVFISGNGAILNSAGKIIELPAGVYLSGQITQRTSIILKPFSKAIMAQVKPWLPPLITCIPMDKVVDDVVSLEYINQDIYQQLTGIDFTNENDLILSLYKALDSYLHISEDIRFIQWAFNRLQVSTIKTSNIANIAIASGYSQRRVEQKFKTLIGLTAKEIQRILQLRQLMDDLSKPGYNQLGILAHRYGYYDQSHFIKSYQRIILETPSCFDVSEYLLPLTGHFDFLQL